MNAGLDFALAQVRDRDLVIESLREQLAEAEFWKQALIAAQERAVAAEAKLAEVEAVSNRRHGRILSLTNRLAEAERQLEGTTGDFVPASFTDEDVERVAEALDPGAFTGPHVESEDWKNRRYDAKTKARRSLSAYLEPTTKGDT